jgi:glutamate formiminotransferase
VGSLECVVNVSEGRRRDVIDALAAAAGTCLLDVHSDEHHNRSVLTLGGAGVEDATQALAAEAVSRLDLRAHSGVHPRIGVLDVVPFVPLGETPFGEALAARDGFASWAATTLGLPCFLYGPERTLPDIRREAFGSLAPDLGPSRPHPSAGACAVGAREVLVAYNVWLAEPDLDRARAIAKEVRGPAVRALGLQVGDGVQVSMNLICTEELGPADAYDAVASRAAVREAELVGLLPSRVLDAVPRPRWAELDLSEGQTIEARLSRSG